MVGEDAREWVGPGLVCYAAGASASPVRVGFLRFTIFTLSLAALSTISQWNGQSSRSISSRTSSYFHSQKAAHPARENGES